MTVVFSEGTVIDERFELFSLLGQGGMGDLQSNEKREGTNP